MVSHHSELIHKRIGSLSVGLRHKTGACSILMTYYFIGLFETDHTIYSIVISNNRIKQ